MIYPPELLPEKNKKLIVESIDDYYLIRFFKEFEGVPVVEGNKLNDIYVFGELNGSTRRIIDLSTLLFGIYRTEHCKLQLTPEGVKEYKDYCKPDCEVTPPVFNKHFEIREDIRYWTIKAENLKDKTLTYINPNTKDVKVAKCRVMHTPKLSNYWHHSIDWEIDEGLFANLLTKSKGFEKKAKKFGIPALVLFKKFAELNEPPTKDIPEELYLKD